LNLSNSKQPDPQFSMVGRDIGPYRILQKLAQGSMCAVYKGVHTGIEQEVAIKFLLPEYFDDKSFRERFVKEAKIQARLSHPNVVKTLNFVENDHTVMMVMEYVNGETLDTLLKKIGCLPPQRALAILESVLEALDFMHSKGIVHRDLKPANIMISCDGFVKVMDFGIAKVLGEDGRTKTGIRIGTLWYMSPEQIKGDQATTLSDIYSIGVTLYQMVTGIVPFDGDTEFEIMKGHIEKKPVPPWKLNKDLDTTIGDVILKAIAKDPRDRFQSVKELLTNIQSALKPVETTKIVAQTPKIRRLSRVWVQQPSATRRKILSASVVLIIAVTAFFSFYLFARTTEETVARPNNNIQALPDIKAPVATINEPAAKPVAVGTAEKELPPSSQQKASLSGKSASGSYHAKAVSSSQQRKKSVSNRPVKKDKYAGVKKQAAPGSNKNTPRPAGTVSGSKDKKQGKEDAWSIRK
jgi:serine/threonine protein kinase